MFSCVTRWATLALLLFMLAGRLEAQQRLTFDGVPSPLTYAGISSPIGVAVDSARNVYIADQGLAQIVKLTPQGVQSSLGSGFVYAFGVAVDTAGNVYASDFIENIVVEIAPGGQQTTIASNLSQPEGLAVDPSGNVFVANHGDGTILEIAPGGQPIVYANGFTQPTSVALDSAGLVYVTDAGTGVVTQITSNSYNQVGYGFVNPTDIAIDLAGNIFVADASSSHGGVYVLEANAPVQLGIGLGSMVGVAADQSGNLFLTNLQTGTFETLRLQGATAGSANRCAAAASTPAPCSSTVTLQFSLPDAQIDANITGVQVVTQGAASLDFTIGSDTCTGVDVTGDGSCSVTVAFNPLAAGARLGAIRLTGSLSGAPVGVLASVPLSGTGLAPLAGVDAGIITTLPVTLQGTGSSLLTGLTADANGDIFFADSQRCLIEEFSALTASTSVVAGNGTCSATNNGDGGPATSASFLSPTRVAVDGQGDLYIADPVAARVRRVDAATGIITTIAGNGSQGYTADGALAANAQLQGPSDVVVDGAGNVFIDEQGNNVVRRVDAFTGILSTVAGNHALGAGFSGDGSAATSAQISSPAGLTIDGSGNLYIADTQNSVIREVAKNTGLISTIAGQFPNTCTFAGNGGAATSAELCHPAGVAVDAAGNLYIADSANLVVRKVSASTGIIAAAAGVYSSTNTPSYSGDGGAAKLAGLSYVPDVALDGVGNIYIADENNGVIRKVTPGSGIATFGTIDLGSSSAATDIAITNNGNMPLNASALTFANNFNGDGADTTCASNTVLQAGTSCEVGIEFLPASSGPLTGMLVLTSNSGNTAGAQIAVALSGTGLAVASKLAVAGLPSSIPAGGNLGVIHVSVEDSSGGIVTASNASITLVITGPSGFSQTFTAVVVDGVATFNLGNLPLTAPGTYTVSVSSTGLNGQTATVAVTASAPAQELLLHGIAASVVEGQGLGAFTVSVDDVGGTLVANSSAAIQVTITGPNGYAKTLTVAAVNGIAAFDFSADLLTTVGTYTVTATSAGVTGVAATFVVEQGFTFAVSASAGSSATQTVFPGGTAVYHLALAPVGATFTQPITLTASGLPAGATYSISPTVVTPGSATVSVILTIKTAATTASAQTTARDRTTAAFLALFLLPVSAVMRLRKGARTLRSFMIVCVLLSLTAIGSLTGCAAGGLFGASPTTHIITVRAGSASLVHSVTVTLVEH